MKLSQEEKLTIKSYNEGALDWTREHSDPYWQEEFIILKKLLPKGKILEVGCGGGRDAKTLIKMGRSRLIIQQQKMTRTGKWNADARIKSAERLSKVIDFCLKN